MGSPSTVIDPTGCSHEFYKTRIVGQYCGDHLLETYTPFGVIEQFGNSGAAVGFSYPPGFVEREQERRDALEEFDEIEQGHGI